MKEIELVSLISSALDSFSKKHSYLLDRGANERSVTHHIANCIERGLRENKMFDHLDVDCEYNRVGAATKRIRIQQISNDDLNANTVYPDIIVHRRGDNVENWLVIEAKWEGRDAARDLEKIKGYFRDLGYRYGLLLSLPTDPAGGFGCRWLRCDLGSAIEF